MAESLHTAFFHKPLSPADQTNLPNLAREEGRAFLDGYDANRYIEAQDELDTWYRSSEGQKTLQALLLDSWQELMQLKDGAMPAHDARHAIIRVPASALDCLGEDQLPASARVAVLSALYHDQGRWVEERLFGEPTESVFHARISYLLAKERLSRYSLPAILRDEILYAVLTHTSGANPGDPVIASVTVSADREQLSGPEIILRLTHHLGMGGMYSVSGTTDECLLKRLVHFPSTLLPAPTEWLARRQNEYAPDPLAFVILADGLDSSWLDKAKEKARPEVWEEAQRRANQWVRTVKDSPTTLAMRLIDAEMTCKSQQSFEAVSKAIREVKGPKAVGLAKAYSFAIHRRNAESAKVKARLIKWKAVFEAEEDIFSASACSLIAPLV